MKKYKNEAEENESISEKSEFITFKIDNQLFGIPITQVNNILVLKDVSPVPLSPPEVVGVLNLRGKIITIIDVRVILNLPLTTPYEKQMCVSVEYENSLYALLVDEVGEVLNVVHNQIDNNNLILKHKWREHSKGIYQLKNEIMIIIDIKSIIDK